ncbi:MAG: hypothetical protein L3J35_00070 [Bacteroidales bacterium]|nr:hypothetical protein [Bacteroidales bacterium]
MKNSMKYIDKLSKGKLENYQVIPETDWKLFKENYSGKFIVEDNLKFNFKNYLTTKNILFSVAGASVITAGIFFSTNSYNKEGMKPVYKNTINNNDFAVSDKYNSSKSAKPLFIEKEFEIKDSASVKETKEKDVVIRVEVPVVKNVEIRKEIIVKDTLR